MQVSLYIDDVNDGAKAKSKIQAGQDPSQSSSFLPCSKQGKDLAYGVQVMLDKAHSTEQDSTVPKSRWPTMANSGFISFSEDRSCTGATG